MATYLELFDILQTSSALKNRVAVACMIAAEAVRSESDQTTNHANRLKWAKAVFERPNESATAMLSAILAANNSLTTTQINNVTDANLQTAVNNAVNVMAQG